MKEDKIYRMQRISRKPATYDYKFEKEYDYSKGKYGKMNFGVSVPSPNLEYQPCILCRLGTKRGWVVLRFLSAGEIIAFFDDILKDLGLKGADIQESLNRVKLEVEEIEQLRSERASGGSKISLVKDSEVG